MAELVLKDVEKTYGKSVQVLRDINLEIEEGELVVFVGPSGCGKSTLLRMIAGLERITGGDLMIEGQRMNDVPPAQRGIAMVFQSYALYPHMTVRENMSFALKLARKSKAEIDAAVDRAAAALQLEPYLDRLPKALSGGQRQRVAIGRSIVRDPKVYLFDEPLSNLDAALRVATRIEIARLKEAMPDRTMIYVTHDQVEAMTLASRIVVLRGGKIEQVGTPSELYTRPANLFVAGFIGSPKINTLPARVVVEDSRRMAKLADFPAFALPELDSADAEMTLCVRPEKVRLGGGDITAEGRIRLVEYLGAETLVYIDLPSGQSLLFHAAGPDTHRTGDSVTVGIDLADLHYFDAEGNRTEPPLARAA